MPQKSQRTNPTEQMIETSVSAASNTSTTIEPANNTLYVCPLDSVDDALEQTGAQHLITLINAQAMIDTPSVLKRENHLRLAMNDIINNTPGLVQPGEEHVTQLLEFSSNWPQQTPLLIHCWAGVSRSTAAAFIIACQHNPDYDEHLIAAHLRKASPTAYPNRRLVEIADNQLGRAGRMSTAIEKIGPGELTQEAKLFSLPLCFAGAN